jgi:dTMP kinase
MGTFIVFEGGEGSGKSTQARALHQSLLRRGYPALLTHEPGGTELGEQVRRLLKGQADATPLAWLFLFSAARAQLLQEVVRPMLAHGSMVVCDRYVPSTIAYQSYGGGLDMATVAKVTQAATQGLQPDVVVLLDQSPALGLERKHGQTPDQFESEDVEFHQRVRQGYLEQARAEPERWLVVDATLAKEQVAEVIWRRVEFLLKGT